MPKRKTTTEGANAADVRAIHTRLKEIIREEIEKLPGLLEQLPAAERVKVLTELLPYCAPKLDKAPPDFAEGVGSGWGW
jgi:hypothetical protein